MVVFDNKKYREIISSVNLSGLRNKSIFITGGTGFFGLWLLNLLAILNEDGYEIKVTSLSRAPEKFLINNPNFANISWLTWVEGDIANYSIPENQFDLLIHGAANTKPEPLDRQINIFEGILFGAHHVMKHAVKANVKRVLFISSGAVYGEIPPDVSLITEEVAIAPLTNKPENALGEGKRAAEMLTNCFAVSKGIEVVIARCFAFTGFGIGEHLVLGQLIKQAIHNDKIVINGSGLARRSFLHGRDLSIWLLKLLVDGKNGEIYNVGSDQAFTIKQLAELVRDEIAPEKKIIVLGAQKQEQRLNYVPSIEKAKTLGLAIWTDLKDAIKETQ